MTPESLVIIPTYNERDNVRELILQIFNSYKELSILVVDDNSPDQTAKAVEELQKKYSQLHLLRRHAKTGLGRAYVDGISWALARDYKVIIEMDADHSHRVVDLGQLLANLRSDVDFVVGSRWVKGGGILNWSWFRRFLSLGGNLYVAILLGRAFADWTGGFNVWRSHVLRKMDLSTLEAQGYSFQIELKYRALRLNFFGIEVPIIFEERRTGQSKMSPQIVVEALIQVWRLKSKF